MPIEVKVLDQDSFDVWLASKTEQQEVQVSPSPTEETETE